jgi:hypothetical protein
MNVPTLIIIIEDYFLQLVNGNEYILEMEYYSAIKKNANY